MELRVPFALPDLAAQLGSQKPNASYIYAVTSAENDSIDAAGAAVIEPQFYAMIVRISCYNTPSERKAHSAQTRFKVAGRCRPQCPLQPPTANGGGQLSEDIGIV